MCDTCAIGKALTRGGTSIFAKNSDREPDEAQVVLSLSRGEHLKGETVSCTYKTIPQAGRTHGVLLSKPFWMWGAEMGVNEKGVVIGNEALFTKVKPEKKPGLIGMDLLRLGLERGGTAREALDVIIDLLQRHGQGGACGYRDKGFTYMNSFLVMDREEIIVLETVGRDYAAQFFEKRAAISNGITLSDGWERSSLPRGTDMGQFTDPLVTFFSGSRARRGAVLARMGAEGGLGVEDAFAALRGHRGARPLEGFNRDVCMHASDPFLRRSHTTGSLVVELDRSEGFRIFVTAGSSPCLTPFKPVLPGAVPADVARGGDRFDEGSFWWRNKAFLVQAETRLSRVLGQISEDVLEIEKRFARDMPFHPWGSRAEGLSKRSRDAFEESSRLEAGWTEKMKGLGRDYRPIHNAYWSMVAKRAGVP